MRLFGGTIGASSEAVDPDEKRRQERVRIAMQSLNEIPRGRLEFGRHMVVDTVTTEIYTVVRGEVDEKCSPADAFYLSETGDAIFLERHAARTLAVFEARQAAREQARAERMRPRARR